MENITYKQQVENIFQESISYLIEELPHLFRKGDKIKSLNINENEVVVSLENGFVIPITGEQFDELLSNENVK